MRRKITVFRCDHMRLVVRSQHGSGWVHVTESGNLYGPCSAPVYKVKARLEPDNNFLVDRVRSKDES